MPSQIMKMRFASLSEILEGLLKKKSSPLSEIYFLFQLSQNWRQLAGEEIAKTAQPIQFKNNDLILSLPDSSHMQEMHFAKETLRKKINTQFPKRKIKRIILKIKESRREKN